MPASKILTADAFGRARSLFEAALAWPAGERAQRLKDACGDARLLALVEGMLRADGEPHRLLDTTLAFSVDRLRPGDRVGPHLEVTALIGRGGMGEVYQAHDSSLNRAVALKILPAAVSADGAAQRDRLARLRREAQVLAQLNHPNIAAIYGIEEWPAPSGAEEPLVALVLELVHGPTLADRLATGPLAVTVAVPLARQIAEAIEAAHAQGIVHRDLKPANVSLGPDGTVKLLDFGLAKMAQPHRSGENAVASPALTDPALALRGVLLGSPAYMSPEQARGHEADARSDIWAFGVVLYEMLSGRRAFAGDDAATVLGAVIHQPIDWAALDPATPPAVRALVQRCLERDPRRRLRDIGEARIVLDDVAAGVTPDITSAAPVPVRGLRGRHGALLAAAVAGVFLTAVLLWPRPPLEEPRVSRFTLDATPSTALDVDSQSRDLALAPSGRHIVYKGGSRAGGTQLFVRALDRLEPVALTPFGMPKAPFLSPDGQWVGFFEPGAAGVTLKKVAISGGPIVDLCHVDGASRGATWRDDGVVVLATAAPDTGLQRVSSTGGAPEVLTRPDHERGERDHLWPQFLPGGKAVLFTITAVNGGMEAAQIAVLDLATGITKTLIRGGRLARYTSSGHLVYVAGAALMAVPFDLARGETRGSASVLVPAVLTLPTGDAEFDVAGNGTLLYTSGEALAPRRTLVWVDRSGRDTPLEDAPARPYAAARLSPDGTQLALEIDDGDNDIWVWHLARRTLTRVTTDPGLDEGPIWMPDGRHLIFTSQADGAIGSLFRQAADGSGAAERLTHGTSVQRASAVLSGGRGVLFQENGETSVLALGSSAPPPALSGTAHLGHSAVVSPDGRWLASVGSVTGAPQIFVRPYPGAEASITQVSTAGGSQPVWARNGRELFYLAPDGGLMRVPVGPSAALAVGAPTRVFARTYFDGAALTSPRTYDVSPDGTRFLMIKGSTEQAASTTPVRMVVVLNWFEELRRTSK